MSEWDTLRAENTRLREAAKLSKAALVAECESDEYGYRCFWCGEDGYPGAVKHDPRCARQIALTALDTVLGVKHDTTY